MRSSNCWKCAEIVNPTITTLFCIIFKNLLRSHQADLLGSCAPPVYGPGSRLKVTEALNSIIQSLCTITLKPIFTTKKTPFPSVCRQECYRVRMEFCGNLILAVFVDFLPNLKNEFPQKIFPQKFSSLKKPKFSHLLKISLAPAFSVKYSKSLDDKPR